MEGRVGVCSHASSGPLGGHHVSHANLRTAVVRMHDSAEASGSRIRVGPTHAFRRRPHSLGDRSADGVRDGCVSEMMGVE